MSVDVEKLLQEISDDAPCGAEIDYAASLELERLAAGTPETQFGEAEEPNWREVSILCLKLLEDCRHIRVVLYLALSSLCTNGVSGLRDGLALLRGTIEKYWDTAHPQLDPDDNNDPLERMNIVAALSPPAGTFQDPMRFRERFMTAPLCNSRQMGKFGLRDILMASGEIPPAKGEEDKAPRQNVIDAAFEDTDIDELQATHQAIKDCVTDIAGIEEFLNTTVGRETAPNLSSFKKLIQQAQSQVENYLDRRGYSSSNPTEDGHADEQNQTQPATDAEDASPTQQERPPMSSPGEIQSSQDVQRALDKICQYYEKVEPSSPIPLLLKRAKRLVGKSFVDVIRDLSPDAITQIQSISGSSSGEEN